MTNNVICDFGLVYGCCCGTDKNGGSIDTEKLHKATLRVIYDGEEYLICKGCTQVHFGYNDYRDDTEIYDIKTGSDVTMDVGFG